MIIVDKRSTDLVAGFDRIKVAESQLSNRWRYRLLVAFARRQAVYESQQAFYLQRLDKFLARAGIGFWLSTALLLFGLLVLPAQILISELGNLSGVLICFAPLLIASGLIGWGILGGLWYWHREHSRPQTPLHPLQIDLLKPLLPAWHEGLRGKLPVELAYHGAIGVYNFIARLESLSDDAYLLYRLNLEPGFLVDLTIVAPNGVWVFAVRHLDGLIRWQNGQWTQLKPSRDPGNGYKERKGENIQPIDRQWQHMCDLVAQTLNDYAPDLETNLQIITRVRGGLVFTHPEAAYEIPPGCPFNWGIITFWLEKLQSIPHLPGMDESAILLALEALLCRHKEVTGERGRISMDNHAGKLIHQTEDRIAAWIQEI